MISGVSGATLLLYLAYSSSPNFPTNSLTFEASGRSFPSSFIKVPNLLNQLSNVDPFSGS
ncbi:unnamed protein product [Meloidogyne enterolobii]|uniref:Uncharacterized protein n=1 Tax=Meloidogyne enterolobii TaxID=390850 RepID=A0ACB0Z5J0_MELEN